MAKEADTTFRWDSQSFLFEGDERIDPELFALATQSWAFLDKTLDGLRLDEDSHDYHSRLLLIYFGARIFGSTVAGTMILAHRLGREAIMLARSQYEYFIKMLYYDHFKVKASEVIELLQASNFAFSKKVGRDISAMWSSDEIEHLDTLSKQAKEPNFTNEIMTALRDDKSFLDSSEENPFAAWFYRNLEPAFRTHWNYGSTIVHASPVDILNVVLRRSDGHFDVNVDSRMKAPNKTISDLTQRCFSTTGLIRWRFGLEFGKEHLEWAEAFQAVSDRHRAEPADIRSMHD